jgi:hypothetical protein
MNACKGYIKMLKNPMTFQMIVSKVPSYEAHYFVGSQIFHMESNLGAFQGKVVIFENIFPKHVTFFNKDVLTPMLDVLVVRN